MSSHFVSRHRKDLSVNMIRTKIAHRKSLSQKESRYKEYERNRHFGLKDVNIPTLESKILLELDETSQNLVPEKAKVKPRSKKTILGDQRKQMLQKYKEEKQLQKLKEQREKAKRGVFKVGLYRPDMPCFLLSNQSTVKAEPKKAVSSFVRITRSKAKDQMEHTKINNGSDVRAIQPGQRQTSERKVLDKEEKVVQPVMTTSVRLTRSATQAAKQIARTVSSTTARKPIIRATNDHEMERQRPNQRRPTKKTETKPDKVVSFKVDSEDNTLDLQIGATNGMDPDGVLPKMENLPKNTAKTKGKNSFAPQDFVFQPLDGLKTYQVKPMTPRSANAFLTPSYTWTPLKTEVDKTQEVTKEILTQECKTYSAKMIHQDSDKLKCPLGSLTVWNKEHVLNKDETTTKNSNGLTIKEVPSLEIIEDQISQPHHDVLYFRNSLRLETEKLTSHCLEWDRKLELDIPDDAKDLIRTAVGQTRLLMKERFKQFEGLVDNCEYKRGEKETTCTDLDGFWDMVSFQIEDVNQKFNNLTKLEESGWQNNNNISKKVPQKKVVSGVASKPKQDDDGRIAARNRLAAIKHAMREKMKQKEPVEAAASVMPKEVDKIVFDAGFFRIESPIKSFSGLSISSECLSQRLRTPKSVSKTVSESRAEMDHLRQTMSPQNPDPQSTKSEHVDKETLLSTIPKTRNSTEDAQCPGLQGLIEVNDNANKINFEMACLPSERMNLPFLAGEVADDINTNKKKEIPDVIEGLELHSSVTAQDILMSSPEKNIPSQNNILQEEKTKISQSVFDTRSLTTERHLLDSPDLNCSTTFTWVERKHQDHIRHISFGGNLIAFSPLRPFSDKQPEEF
ncbi:disks large-associated protein 5 [Canis lupus familiaris]|uniref:DLG associated protein 5 n=2 Tax=Canis lupus familiaris TaxID=9615 RepID=A0A8C0PUJ6_CANLF|nr:disks large-associated protein 5 [Canis lupus familiaris]XP_025299146.2 disks large-associated protein 5 [Canis lupus dingo]XP_038529614.1 disks large-associated protein 5 [Canis lupus familiaris]|eukprot:XP_013971390.1 disks large-associated protein 5 [Canis lupus familiaris]